MIATVDLTRWNFFVSGASYDHPKEIEVGDRVRFTQLGVDNFLRAYILKLDVETFKRSGITDAWTPSDFAPHEYIWEVCEIAKGEFAILQLILIEDAEPLYITISVNQIRAIDDPNDEQISYHPALKIGDDIWYFTEDTTSGSSKSYVQNGFDNDVIYLSKPSSESSELLAGIDAAIDSLAGEYPDIRSRGDIEFIYMVSHITRKLAASTKLEDMRQRIMADPEA